MINKYLASIRMGFKDMIVYRFHLYMSLITAPLSLLIYYYLWKSIYSYAGQAIINGFTFNALITYYAINTIIGWFVYSEVDAWFEQNIINGELIADLLIPVNLFSHYFLVHRGYSIFGLMVETIPFLFIAKLVFNIPIPGFWILMAFILALFFAVVLEFMISYIVGLTAFWLKRITGIRKARRTIVLFLAGGMLPLSFFPQWFQDISFFLPFKYIRDAVVNIWLGNYEIIGMLQIYLLQILWIGVLGYIIYLMWKRASKRFSGAGT
ncbi:MAG: ABC-2 family transporter protein [Candidatus Nanoarchaeia archaeon]|nr:ABC-2 family transporter protein [Candidatus Nanoarchaeia archaeon]